MIRIVLIIILINSYGWDSIITQKMTEPIEQKIEIPTLAEISSDNTWHSFCMTMDKNAVQYFTTIGIISGIMACSIYKLTTNESCEAQTAYMGLLTLLLGILSPSPVFKK